LKNKWCQEIKDAYAQVNIDGEVYKNARIQEEFLDSRLDEVKWGVAVQKLKERAREEQRAIKEQIRDEQRAKKEKEVVDELDIESTWTMESEASEYREAVALEESMRSNVNVRRKWLADQATSNFEEDDFEDAEQEFEDAEA
jgi:hypothetical protein